MEKLDVGSGVEALPESNTWMSQYGVAGSITEIFHKDGKSFAKISVPRWLVRRNHGECIIRDWLRRGFMKPTDDALFLDEGILIEHLKSGKLPEQTADETVAAKVESLIDQAFGFKGNRLGINVVYYPQNLVVSPGVCAHGGCDQLRTHLAWHNNHGTVEAFMVCEPHYYELNGRCSDGFPLKMELLSKTA